MVSLPRVQTLTFLHLYGPVNGFEGKSTIYPSQDSGSLETRFGFLTTSHFFPVYLRSTGNEGKVGVGEGGKFPFPPTLRATRQDAAATQDVQA